MGYLIFAPLMITAAIGAIGQEKLPQEIFDFVERMTLLHGQPVMNIMETAFDMPASVCAVCHSPLSAGAKFCSSCGAPVQARRTCPGCGAEVGEGARFCSDCGTKLS